MQDDPPNPASSQVQSKPAGGTCDASQTEGVDAAAQLSSLLSLRDTLLAAERQSDCSGSSDTNFVHYLQLRCHELRGLQAQLTALGLSSLGRSERHVLATVDSVLRALSRLANQPLPPSTARAPPR